MSTGSLRKSSNYRENSGGKKKLSDADQILRKRTEDVVN
jgi:hypothetical protein